MANTHTPNKLPVTTERIYALMRKSAELALVLITQDAIIEEMEQAGTASTGTYSGYDDPVLIASTRRVIRSSLMHWLDSTIESPELPVTPYISETILLNAIAMLELGVPDRMYSLDRASQNVAWKYWMELAFQVTDHPQELKQLLHYSFKSISDYVQASEELLKERLKQYEEKHNAKYAAATRALVIKILEGDLSAAKKLVKELDYSMTDAHYAAVIWCEEGDAELSKLEQAAAFFIDVCNQTKSLNVLMSGASLWVWVAASNTIDEDALKRFVKKYPGIKLTYGKGGRGVEGFRKAHMDAIAAQRVLGRLRSTAAVVSYDNIRLAEIMSRDPEATNRYISNILGDLKNANHELKMSLLTYIECGCNANQAAQTMHTHRNTMVRRLNNAESLLPQPLESNIVQVSAALEMSRWLV